MADTIRWGIWGAGIIADKVANDFRFAPGNQLYAIASRTPAHAQAFAAKHGATAIYASLPQLLADPNVDVVYIATPNHMHMDDCLACIAVGKAVLCEKPFTLSAAQAERVIAAARSRGVFCMEAMWTRFIPAIVDAKRRIDAGELGAIRRVTGTFAHVAAAGEQGRLYDPAMGGGVLLDLGVYLVSLCQHLLGEPQSAYGTATLAATGVDAESSYQLRYLSGAQAELFASLRVRSANEFYIVGDRGSLLLHGPFCKARGFDLASSTAESLTSTRQRAAGTLQDTRFAQALLRLLRPLLNKLRGRATLELPYPGNGYQFQLLEVSRCLAQGQTESRIMPLTDTLSVMQTMDELRAQWGLRYPGQ